MPRFLLLLPGGPPVVTPDLGPPLRLGDRYADIRTEVNAAVEEWMFGNLGIPQEGWSDVPPGEMVAGGWWDVSCLGTWGDPATDWPISRTDAAGEHMYIGPLTIYP